MSEQEQSEWPTFESVFGEIAPGTPTARERVSELAIEEATSAPIDVDTAFDSSIAFDDPDLQAALEPLPEVVEPDFYDDIIDLDNPGPGEILAKFDEPFSTKNISIEESVEIDTIESVEPQSAFGEDDTGETVDPVDWVNSFDDDDGWVTHTAQDVEATEPEITSTAPTTQVLDSAPFTPPEPAAVMSLAGLFDPVGPPLEADVDGTELDAQQAPAPTSRGADPDDPWGQLRPKNEPEKITFWANRPKFFGGDERRKARAQRERAAARNQQQSQPVHHAHAVPESLPCPVCEHVSKVDIVDPVSGQLHIRCDLCGHIWAETGR